MANADMAAPPLGITRTPGVCGGDACVRLTRIPVWVLVSFRRQGVDDAGLLESYPSLEPADLAAAWEYHRQHPDEINAAIADQERDD